MDNSSERECHLKHENKNGLFEIHNTLLQRASGGKIKGKVARKKKTREVRERTEPCAIKKKRSYTENFPMVWYQHKR